MKAVVLQSNYIPWKGYFDLIQTADVFCFYDEVQYTKNDWRNRNKIIGPNGPFWLTIPVNKDAVKGTISEVTFRNTDWVSKHLISIKQSYSKSPYKNDVLCLLEGVYKEAYTLSLSEFNQKLIIAICSYIGINTIFKNSASFSLSGDRISRLINLLVDLKVTEYISGPSAISYLKDDENKFTDQNITLSYFKYGPYECYKQRSENFEDNISIIDVLMNVPQEEVFNYIKN